VDVAAHLGVADGEQAEDERDDQVDAGWPTTLVVRKVTGTPRIEVSGSSRR